MKTSYLVILLFISCSVNSNTDYDRDSAINYVMIEEALQRRIDAIKDKIDIEKRERERRIQENNEKFDELQRRVSLDGETIEVKDADRDTRIKRGKEDNVQESKKLKDGAAGQQPNFLFQSGAQPSDHHRIIRRRNAARRFRGSPSRLVRSRRRRRIRSPRRRRRRRRRRNKNLRLAYAENFAKVEHNNGRLSRFKRV